jgi:hypothetical protein
MSADQSRRSWKTNAIRAKPTGLREQGFALAPMARSISAPMPVVSFLIAPQLEWILSEDDPSELEFPLGSPLAGSWLLNPLNGTGAELEGFPQRVNLTGGKCFFASTSLNLRGSEPDPAAMGLAVESLLFWMRFVSGRPAVPRVLGHQVFDDEQFQ